MGWGWDGVGRVRWGVLADLVGLVGWEVLVGLVDLAIVVGLVDLLGFEARGLGFVVLGVKVGRGRARVVGGRS